MLIFEATQEHFESLYEIEQICFSHPWSKDSLLSELVSQNTIRTAFKIKEEIVGFCLLSVVAGEGTILQVAVLPSHRGMGIGKRLTEHALFLAKEKGAEVIFLEVRVSNTSARGLYESLGFEEIAVRKGYYRDGETAIIMQRRIKNEDSGN